MKKMITMLMVLAFAVSMLGSSTLASGYKDYSTEGLYSLWVTMPAGYDHVYLYDRPSSTKGYNLGRINDGDVVYVYYTTDGLNHNSVWAYCDFMGTSGYIRFCNLVPEYYDWYDETC